MENHSTLASATQQTPLGKLSKQDHALALAAQGFRVFPLEPNGKTPAHAGVNWRKIASKDPQRVAEMWTDPVMESELDYNIGIALDAKTVVVDVDVRDGKRGLETFEKLTSVHGSPPITRTHKTASGGLHFIFKTPTPVGNSASKVGEHIDIKSEGGFVVGPGSTIDGVAYEVLIDHPIAAANDWIVQLAGAPRVRITEAGAAPLVDLDTAEAIKRATEYLTTKAPDSGTYSVAAKVKDFGVSEETCLDLMLEHWRDPRGLPKDDDHIRFRVENAYRYGQNAPGIASAEAEFDAVEIETAIPAPKRRGLNWVDWADAKADFEQPYLIDGMIDLGSMVVTYGDSNVGKTFVKLDQAYHIAAGIEWNGRKVRQGVVVYVAAEGGKGFLKRIEAFKCHYRVATLPFVAVPCPIDLFSQGSDVGRLVELVQAAEQRHGLTCVFIIVDTLARAMAEGDENTATDMGKFVANCDRIRQRTGAAIDIIHHTGKDKAKGARGSSALRAATDTEIEIDRGVVRIAKQRDLEANADLRFELVPVEIGKRSDGQAVTSCVVRWIAQSETEFAAPIDSRLEEALTAFETALNNKDNSGSLLSFTEWTNAYAASRSARGKTSGTKQALVRCSKGLIEAGYIAKTKDGQYVRTSAK